MKIIIIGAGIAGLTLGVACQQAGMDVKIYDKSKQLQNIGGGILLWPHGQRYLDWLGLGDVLASLQQTISACNIIGSKGDVLLHENCSALFSELGGAILPVDRSEFQLALAAKLEPGTLILNKECIDVEDIGDDADLIVGADGIHSVIRYHINKNAELNYTGYCWYGGIIDHAIAPNFSSTESYLFSAISKICVVWPTSQNRLMWYLPIKMPLSEFIIKDKNKLLDVTQHWHADISAMMSAPDSSQSFYVPIYTVPPQEVIANNKMVLIGDAAHAVGPILGQGASQAIEDAFVLFNCLMNIHEEIPDVLNYYQSLRIEKYKRIAALENQTAELMVCDDEATQAEFEHQAPQMSLTDMYEELIPLIDEVACLELARAASDMVYDAEITSST